MIDRHRARILALQALFQVEAQGPEALADLPAFLADEEAPAAVAEYARRLVEDATTQRERYDRLIREAAENWDLDRMTAIDRNVMRLAVCELADRPEVPAVVAIDQAVELAKEFGSAESGRFVNGVLDAIRAKLDRNRG